MRFLHILFADETNNIFIQLLRYAIVGGTSFVIDFGLLFILTEFASFHYLLSATISFIIGLVTNFLLGTAWIFKNSKIKSHSIEFIAYSIVGIVGLGLNNLLLYLLTSIIGLYYMLSKIITAAIVMFWNFFGRRMLYK